MMESSPKAPQIFISHSHADNDLGIRLTQDLQRIYQDKQAVWYDQEGGLQPGNSWWSDVVDALTVCKIFLMILSPDSITSNWVRREYEIALNEEKRIIPLYHRECELRADLKLIQRISFLPPRKYEEALDELLTTLGLPATHAIAQEPVDPQKPQEEYFNAGLRHHTAKRYPEALLAFNQALEINPNDARIYGRRADVYRELKEYALALRDFDHAFELEPGSATAWAYKKRSLVYMGMNEYQQAHEDLCRALALTPNDAYIYGRRADLYRILGKHVLALRDLDRAFALNPRSTTAWAYTTRGQVYMDMEEYQQACADLDLAHNMAPQDRFIDQKRREAYRKLEETK